MRTAALRASLCCAMVAVVLCASTPAQAQAARPRRAGQHYAAYIRELGDLYAAGGRGRKRQEEDSGQVAHLVHDLQEHLASFGRGRFGKRQMHIEDESVTYGESPLLVKLIDDPFWKHLGAK